MFKNVKCVDVPSEQGAFWLEISVFHSLCLLEVLDLPCWMRVSSSRMCVLLHRTPEQMMDKELSEHDREAQA